MTLPVASLLMTLVLLVQCGGIQDRVIAGSDKFVSEVSGVMECKPRPSIG